MALSKIIVFRGTPDEYKLLEAQAAERDITPSMLIRELVFGGKVVIQQSTKAVIQKPFIDTTVIQTVATKADKPYHIPPRGGYGARLRKSNDEAKKALKELCDALPQVKHINPAGDNYRALQLARQQKLNESRS